MITCLARALRCSCLNGFRDKSGELSLRISRTAKFLAELTRRNYRQFPHIAVLLIGFASLAGCAVKRDRYDVPAVPLPERYAKAPPVGGAAQAGSNAVAEAVPSMALSGALAEWWRLLGSAELDALMDRALANNPDLRIAALRLTQSQARLFQAGADKVPVLTLPMQSKIEAPVNGIGSVRPGGEINSRRTYQASLRGDWRPDIWGERSALYDSAEMQMWRATFQRDDVQRTTVANVTAAYVEYLTLNDRLRVALETAKALGEMLASVEARLDKGDATVTELEQQKAAVYSAKAVIPVLEQQREVVRNRLATLLGSAPGGLELSDGGLDTLNFPAVLPGIPSALLLRRPDVRAVEARLLAADADIDVARTRILPPLDLTAQIGYGSYHMSQLFQPQTLFWSAIANLSATIFDSGKRSREADFAQAVYEELVETYVRVVYDAVREVDDSLSAIRLIGNRLERQRAAMDAARRAWDFSQESYMAGAVDYLVVLDTERTYHRNLDDWYNVRMERYRSLINLFSALGGGGKKGDALPGSGARPATLTAEIDYGAVLSATVPRSRENSDAAPKPGEAPAAEPAAEQSPDLMLTATLPGRVMPDGVDWTDRLLREDEERWLVEMAGVYERGAVFAAWRDMRKRFPAVTENRLLLPRQQGRVGDESKERVSWYRLYLARYPQRQMAEAACAALLAGQLRCRAVSSRSVVRQGDSCAESGRECGFDAPARTLEKDGLSATIIEPPVPAVDKGPAMESGKEEQQ